jgi:hypothetical protein
VRTIIEEIRQRVAEEASLQQAFRNQLASREHEEQSMKIEADTRRANEEVSCKFRISYLDFKLSLNSKYQVHINRAV